MSFFALLRVRYERRADRRRERRNAEADRIQGPPDPPGSGSMGSKKFFRGGGF
jgi:hypothetical protein